MMGPPIERACFWLASRPPRDPTPLTASADTDVAIVGAGFTGLWTALHLKALAPETAVIVVEQAVPAYGASGRNAGMLSETIDHGHAPAIQHFGEREARILAQLGEANVAELTGFIAARGIACDYEPTGRLMVALTPRQLEESRVAVDTARRLGLTSFRLLDQDAMQAELSSALYLGGVAVSGGGILDPVKLVDGLRREAERLGVRVYEQSRVRSLEANGAGVRLTLERGRVQARRAVLATNAYTHHLLPRLLHRFIPLYDYILVSEPLTPEQKALVGWRHRQGVTDGRTFFNYYRLTADDRILWGTSEALYYPGNRVDPSCDHSPTHYASLRESFRHHFPALAGLEFPYAWGGPICATTRMTPFFGSAMGGRVLYGLGYTGHGVGTTHLAGKILAHLVLGRRSELLDLSLVRRAPMAYPPEPLRRFAVSTVTRGLRRVDAGEKPNLLLRVLERMGIGFSS